MARSVYLIREGGDIPGSHLCEQCIASTIDPEQTRRDIIRRANGRHCIGCDYHADPTGCRDCAEIADNLRRTAATRDFMVRAMRATVKAGHPKYAPHARAWLAKNGVPEE